jgi:hypothetical protein
LPSGSTRSDGHRRARGGCPSRRSPPQRHRPSSPRRAPARCPLPQPRTSRRAAATPRPRPRPWPPSRGEAGRPPLAGTLGRRTRRGRPGTARARAAARPGPRGTPMNDIELDKLIAATAPFGDEEVGRWDLAGPRPTCAGRSWPPRQRTNPSSSRPATPEALRTRPPTMGSCTRDLADPPLAATAAEAVASSGARSRRGRRPGRRRRLGERRPPRRNTCGRDGHHAATAPARRSAGLASDGRR